MERVLQPLIESVPLVGPVSIAIREFRLPLFDHPWHQHPEAELTWILRGEGTRHVGDHVETFRAGDCCFIGPNLPHAWLSPPQWKGGCRSFVCQFDPGKLGGSLLHLPEMSAIRELLQRSEKGVRFKGAEVSASLRGMRRANVPLDRVLALLRSLDRLARHAFDGTLSLNAWTSPPHNARDPRIERVLGYVSRHLSTGIRQAEAARHAGLSPAAFSRVFRTAMGRTFRDYVTDLRIGLACRQLLETRRPINDIAFACGYDNLSNFNRAFRLRRGMPPSEFRCQGHPPDPRPEL